LSVSDGSQNSIDLVWNYASDAQYYSIIVNGDVYASHLAVSSLTFNVDTNQYSYRITGLTAGASYQIDLFAETFSQVSQTYYVSQPATTTATPYSVPSAVRNFAGEVANSALIFTWLQPSNTGGAGQNGNGPMQYYIQVVAQDASNIVVASTTTQSLTWTAQPLINGTSYSASINPFFVVSGSSTQATGPTITENNLVPNPVPAPSTITAIPYNTDSSNNRNPIQVSWTLNDEDFSYNNLSTLYRQITDTATGQILTPFQQIYQGPALTYPDTGNNGTYLNGNTMTYYVVVSYTNNITIDSAEVTAIPYGIPYPCSSVGVPRDISNCITPADVSGNQFGGYSITLSTNGNNLNEFISIGIPTSGSAPVIQYTSTQIQNISYSNSYNSTGGANGIATNQITTQTINYGKLVADSLTIAGNNAGSLLVPYPYDGLFNIE